MRPLEGSPASPAARLELDESTVDPGDEPGRVAALIWYNRSAQCFRVIAAGVTAAFREGLPEVFDDPER